VAVVIAVVGSDMSMWCQSGGRVEDELEIVEVHFNSESHDPVFVMLKMNTPACATVTLSLRPAPQLHQPQQ
jgi:hypothetical protein